MSVPDLHPEDLLEREADGALTPAERSHLDAHLERCAACRFERLARGDFAARRTETERDPERAPPAPPSRSRGPVPVPGHGWAFGQVNRP